MVNILPTLRESNAASFEPLRSRFTCQFGVKACLILYANRFNSHPIISFANYSDYKGVQVKEIESG